jgi:hypothetical protein
MRIFSILTILLYILGGKSWGEFRILKCNFIWQKFQKKNPKYRNLDTFLQHKKCQKKSAQKIEKITKIFKNTQN